MTFLSNIINNSGDVRNSQYVCMYDQDLKIIDCCTNYATLYGTDCSTVKRAQFEEVLLSGTPSSTVVQFTSTTNETIYAEEQIFKLNSGLVVVGKDISKNKEEQKEKEEQEYALSLIAKHSEQFFLLTDIEGKIIFIDKTYPASTMEEVIGSYIYDYHDEKNKQIVRDCITAILKTKKANSFEVSAHIGNGEMLSFEGAISPIIENGVVVKLAITTYGTTERKKVENELKAIKEQYVNLLKLTNSIAFTQDKALRYTSIINPNTSVTNPGEDFDEQIFIGKTDREFLKHFGEDAQKTEADKLEVLRTGKNIRRDSQLIVNGEVMHYDLLIQPLVNEEAEIIGITGTSINVTDRIRKKEALEESERRLNKAEEIAQLGYFDFDLVSGNTNWSEETYRVVGVNSSDFIPTVDNMTDLIHKNDKELVLESISEMIKTGENTDFTYRLSRKNADIRHIRNLAIPRLNAEGRTIGLFGTVQNITQQMELELELKEQKSFIQKIVDSSPSLIFILDIEKRENIFLNNASEKLLGYSTEEVRQNHNLFLNELPNLTLDVLENTTLNKKVTSFLSFIHPSDRALFVEFVHMFVKDRTDQVFDLNFRHKHRGGNWMWLHHRLVAFNRNDKGNVTQLLGIVSDINSLKKAETKSKMAMMEGQEKERSRIAKDLHDAINPLLSAAKLNVESLQCPSNNNEQEKNISNVVSLLSRSMKEIKEISFDLMPSILKDFGLSSTLKDYCKKVTEGGVLTVNLDIHGVKRLGEIQEVMLFRITQELINNVVKHANATQIEVQLIAHQKTIILMVEDNGIGIENTTNIVPTESYGLKNVESRVKTLNGAIVIDSIKDRGTIITIEIPRK